MVRSMAVGALTVGLAVALSLVPAGEASAQPPDDGPSIAADASPVEEAGEIGISSATGMAFFGAACIKGACWPGATLMHIIRGEGRSITYQEGFFTDLVVGAPWVGSSATGASTSSTTTRQAR